MTITELRSPNDDRTGPASIEASIEMASGSFVVRDLVIRDPGAVALVEDAAPSDRTDLVERMIGVGAHGLSSMGIGLDLAALDDRIERTVSTAADEAREAIGTIIDSGARSLSDQFDPERRSSIVAKALGDFTEWRDGFLRDLDPGVEGSTTTELLRRMHDLVGHDGILDRRLREALDLGDDGSALAQLRRSIDTGFEDLRRDLAADRAADDARREEAERGTAHGLEYEDIVEGHLRSWAATTTGTVVERTSITTGSLGAAAKVGDFVVTLADGRRVAIEAKRQSTISLGGSGGILAELDDAMANRDADAAVCVAGRDAFPAEVGRFNVYGDRVLVVDEGDGDMIGVAMRWLSCVGSSGSSEDLDTALLADHLDRIRKTAEQLSGAKRTVTTIRTSLDGLHEALGALRGDILDQLDDVGRLTRRSTESHSPQETHS